MARIKMGNNDAYMMKLAMLGDKCEETAKKAVYAASKVVADEIKARLDALPVQNGTVKPGEKIDGLSQPQKDGLNESFGVTPIKIDAAGTVNAHIGFDGYNGIRTHKYPQGQPNQLIARSVESGSSIRNKHPFVRPAVAKTKKQAVKVMGDVIDAATEKIMK